MSFPVVQSCKAMAGAFGRHRSYEVHIQIFECWEVKLSLEYSESTSGRLVVTPPSDRKDMNSNPVTH